MTRPRPQTVAIATRGTRTRMQIVLTTVTRLALGMFVLYNPLSWLTAELRGCVYYYQHLTVVTAPLVRTFLAVIDVCALSNEINATLE